MATGACRFGAIGDGRPRRETNRALPDLKPQNSNSVYSYITIHHYVLIDNYLNEAFDVTFVIDDVELPAHRKILSQRCPYFRAMFDSGMIESTSKRVVLRETPINGFKSVLKWIYTNVVDFDNVYNALKVLHLAHMYDLPDLVNSTVKYLKSICAVDNVVSILNDAFLLGLNDLSKFCHGFFVKNDGNLLKHKSFTSLSPDALEFILKEGLHDHTNREVLEAFGRWTWANADKAKHFPDLLMQIPLNSINLDYLKCIIPSELISKNDLIDIARQQRLTYEKGLANINVAKLYYGVKVIHGGNNFFFDNYSLLKHEIGDYQGIVIDLGQRFLLNSLTVVTGLAHSFEVLASVDNINWTKIIDHNCTSLYCNNKVFGFNECVVRYICICCTDTVSGVNKFGLYQFEAFYRI